MRININFRDPFKKPKKSTVISAREIAALTRSMCDQLLGVPEIWQVEENTGDNFFNLTQFRNKKRHVPAEDLQAYTYLFPPRSVYVVYENMDKSRPKIIGVCGQIEYERDLFLVGEWMQAEGNFRLSQPGLLNTAIPTYTTELLDIGDFSDSTPGFQRLFGCVVKDGVYVIAYYKTNTGTGNFSHLRLHAFILDPLSRSPIWMYEIPLVTEIDTVVNRNFRANIFLDLQDGVITVCDSNTYSVKLNASMRSAPSKHKITQIDTRFFCSVAGRYMMISDPAYKLKLYKRGENLGWTRLGSDYTLTDLNSFSQAFQWVDSGVFPLSRPWPFDVTYKSFRVLWSSLPGDKIVSAKTNGNFTVESLLPRTDFTAPDYIFEEALLDGDAYQEDNNGGLLMSAPPGPALPGYTVGGNYAVWGGRLGFGPVANYPSISPQFWYHNLDDGITINTVPPYDPPYFYTDPWPVDVKSSIPVYGYFCPRKISNVPSTSLASGNSYLIAQWPESRTESTPICTAPCLRQDSNGGLIWAKIDAVMASVPNLNSMIYSEPQTSTPDDLTVYHWPQKEFLHQTILYKKKSGGSLLSLNISPEFTNLTYTFQNEVNLSNSVRIPVNVWDIKMAQNDSCIVLQDWTEAPEQEHRLALRSVDADNVSLDLITALCNTDTEMDGTFTWKIVDRAMVVNAGESGNKWAVVGIYYLHANEVDTRTEIKFVDISDLGALNVVSMLSEENDTQLPRALDFDRMVFAKKTTGASGTEQCYWVGDIGDGPRWYQFA